MWESQLRIRHLFLHIDIVQYTFTEQWIVTLGVCDALVEILHYVGAYDDR
jgi:hypothetical protein